MTVTVIKPNAGGEFEWCHYHAESVVTGHGDLQQLQAEQKGTKLIFLVPLEDTVRRTVEISAGEKKMFRKTLPYTLEEEFIEDVDELHFAYSLPENNRVSLIACRRQLLDQWLQEFQQNGLELNDMLAESQLFADDRWLLIVDGDRWLLKTNIDAELACDTLSVELALNSILSQSPALPDSITIACQPNEREQVLKHIPPSLHEQIKWMDSDYWQCVQLPDKDTLSLLQGEFSPGLPLRKWWQAWQSVAVIAAVVVLLQLALSGGNYFLLQQQNSDLNRQIESVYREVVPRGAIIDVEKQLQRKISALEGGDSPGFVSMLEKTAKALSVVDSFEIKNLSYNDRQSEMRLTILVPRFKDIDSIRMQLEKSGLIAQMTGSSNEGDRTRAGLRIRG